MSRNHEYVLRLVVRLVLVLGLAEYLRASMVTPQVVALHTCRLPWAWALRSGPSVGLHGLSFGGWKRPSKRTQPSSQWLRQTG